MIIVKKVGNFEREIDLDACVEWRRPMDIFMTHLLGYNKNKIVPERTEFYKNMCRREVSGENISHQRYIQTDSAIWFAKYDAKFSQN